MIRTMARAAWVLAEAAWMWLATSLPASAQSHPTYVKPDIRVTRSLCARSQVASGGPRL